VSYTIADNVELLILGGSAAVTATGNAQANWLYGNYNTGANTLAGGAGDDIYFVGTGDTVTEATGGGSDTVIAYANHVLGNNVENLYGAASTGMSLTGNSLNNRLIGTALSDILIGGIGADLITGGAGNDTFVLTALGDSGVGAGLRDIISDFVSGVDTISFAGIDANTTAGAAGDQAFTMLGTAAFSNVAGQLHYLTQGTNTILEGDVDGDGVADFQLQLTGNHSFVAADLML
jgi:serralysin